jgi:ABC-type Fe3+/spermidine/putrescine transport system ATPase subunit
MSLKINGLSKRFSDKWVLRDVGFEAEPGRIFGIFGASGAGKTTLLRLLGGDLKSDGGTIQLDDTQLNESSPSNWATFFHKPSSRGFLASLFRKTDIKSNEGFAVDFESTLRSSHPILLLDDPFCCIDSRLRQESVETLRSVAAERGLIVLFTSNRFDEMLRTCDEVAVLCSGEVIQTGSPQEIYETPVTCEIAALTGWNNMLEARRLSSSKAETQEFQTIVGGHRIVAQRADLATLGALNQNVWLSIRPEQVPISFGAAFPEDNLLKAVVTKIKQLGPTTLISLDASGLPVNAAVFRLVGLKIGDECMIGLPIDRISILSK